ncbi:class I SAM-dependent methyltransferase [Virgisporangium ochraceum]|uniref:Methyltransferase n=1 Tax=Virgisporangium ochraceum TaxID=65505 RepID=A0A8J3ZKA3_9ACTN|nr:methyltransferase [Virgisporangium ochraceum]
MLDAPEFAAALVAAEAVVDRGPVAAATALRAAGVPPDLAATALTQAALRRAAVGKFGAAAASMFFTRTGLEQATRAPVSAARARRLALAGATRVADLGCGIGADSRAFALAGLSVLAVEADPETAIVAAANLRGLDASVVTGDATTADLTGVDAAFCDPARRTAGGRRVFSPAALSPPWDFAVGLFTRLRFAVLKLAPGLPHDLVPPGAEAQWVSVDGDLVEAALWSPSLAAVPRRATVFRAGVAHELTGDAAPAPVGGPRRYVFDPDGAVTRAGLVGAFAETVDGVVADPSIGFVYAEKPAGTPFARCLEVVDELPVAVKKMRAALRSYDIGRLEIRKRGSALDVEKLRHDLRLSGTGDGVLLLTRIADRPAALLCRRGE